ncbi:U7 snRNA-associated Sm-like protein LSm10 isoform 1-T1 [Thomomys bottae]
MALSHSLKERTISENSPIILLQGLQGQVTTVDLRDESVARGRIDNVDAFMNIRLAKVTYTDRWGHQVELDDLFVTGRNVRTLLNIGRRKCIKYEETLCKQCRRQWRKTNRMRSDRPDHTGANLVILLSVIV